MFIFCLTLSLFFFCICLSLHSVYIPYIAMRGREVGDCRYAQENINFNFNFIVNPSWMGCPEESALEVSIGSTFWG